MKRSLISSNTWKFRLNSNCSSRMYFKAMLLSYLQNNYRIKVLSKLISAVLGLIGLIYQFNYSDLLNDLLFNFRVSVIFLCLIKKKLPSTFFLTFTWERYGRIGILMMSRCSRVGYRAINGDRCQQFFNSIWHVTGGGFDTAQNGIGCIRNDCWSVANDLHCFNFTKIQIL